MLLDYPVSIFKVEESGKELKSRNFFDEKLVDITWREGFLVNFIFRDG